MRIDVGDPVHFEIRNAYHPDQDAILRALHGRDILQGVVIGMTDSGSHGSAFAVLSVEGLDDRIIVPMHCIRPSVPMP